MMEISGKEEFLQLNNFGGGLSLKTTPDRIQDNEASRLINFDIGLGGELKKRPSFQRRGNFNGTGAIRILGIFIPFTDLQTRLMVSRDDSNILYYSTDGIVYTSLGTWANGVLHGIQYVDSFYMVRQGGELVRWTGTGAATAVAGSPSGTCITQFKERIFIVDGGSYTPNRIWFSSLGDPATWPGINFIDVSPGDGDAIVAVIPYQDKLLIFKQQSIYALYIQGTPVNWIVRQISSAIGLTSKDAIKEVDGFLYFVGLKGIYQSDGVTFKLISDNLGNYFDTRTLYRTLYSDSIGLFGDRLIFSLSSEDEDKHKIYVYYYKIRAWTEWVVAEGTSIYPYTFVENTNTIYTLEQGVWVGTEHATENIYILRELEQHHTYLDNEGGDSEAPYVSSLTTKKFYITDPSNYKRGKWLEVEAGGDGTLDVTYNVDEIEM